MVFIYLSYLLLCLSAATPGCICEGYPTSDEGNPAAQRFASRAEAAATFHRLGMEAAANDVHSALQYLRAAVKAVSSNAEYWNDLGVTEARGGLLAKAKQRFSAALRVDSHHIEALQNYEHIKKDLASQRASKTDHFSPEKVFGKLNVIPLEELVDLPTTATLSQEDPPFKKPFIVRGAIAKLRGAEAGSISEHALVEYLRNRHRDAPTDFYPQNMLLSRPEKVYFLPLSRAIEQIASVPDLVYADVDASQQGSYAQWNMNQSAWIDVLSYLGLQSLPYPFQSVESEESSNGGDPFLACLSNDARLSEYLQATHWLMLLLGETGAGMHNHQDDLRAASFQLQLAGRKRWHICPPTDSLWDGKDWVERPRESGQEQGNYMYGAAKINMFKRNIDYGKYPLLVNATCFEGIVNTGDLIYYPKDFWHQTLNLETPTLSLSGNLLTKSCSSAVHDRLHEECLSVLVGAESSICQASDAGTTCSSFASTTVNIQGQKSVDNLISEGTGVSVQSSPRYRFDKAMCTAIAMCSDRSRDNNA